MLSEDVRTSHFIKSPHESRTLSMLCSKCLAIDFQFLEDLPFTQQEQLRPMNLTGELASHHREAEYYYFYVLKDNFGDLQVSAGEGCHLCALIYTALTDPPKWWSTKPILRRNVKETVMPIVLRTSSGNRRIPFAQNVLANDKTQPEILTSYDGHLMSFRLVQGIPDDLAKASHNLGAAVHEEPTWKGDSTTGSRASMALLKLWLEHCEKEHSQCRLTTTSMPTRVIYVGNLECPTHPFLVEPSAGKNGRYIALSHCWGSPSSLAVTQSWAADQSNLPTLDQWPHTFQQAVYIARTLHIPYLWIDTVCIKQGDEADFAKEAARMSSYYSDATLVVAASHARDAREGCFSMRNPLLVRPCPVGFKSSGQGPQKAFYFRLEPKLQTKMLKESDPLRSRAWALQESLLSRRIVYFYKDQLHWSCIAHKANESRPEGLKTDDLHWQMQPLMLLRVFLHHPPRNARESSSNYPDPGTWYEKMVTIYKAPTKARGAVSIREGPDPAYQKWYDCVEEFTARQITFRKDVLPAISGLAQKISGAFEKKGPYLAGIWQQDLIRGLLWAVFEPKSWKDQNTPSLEYFAPSWSWVARFEHRISYYFDPAFMYDAHENTRPTMPELMAALAPRDITAEVDSKYQSAMFGEVEKGVLRLWGRLIHGGTIGQMLQGRGSVYHKTHPAFHRGLAGFEKEGEKIHNWKLTVPSFSVTEEPKESSDSKNTIEGEIALDYYHLGHMLSPHEPPKMEGEVSVLMLWPFKFQGDRCIGLGLLRSNVRSNEYRRVGRVELVIPHDKLWTWIQSNPSYEEVIIM